MHSNFEKKDNPQHLIWNKNCLRHLSNTNFYSRLMCQVNYNILSQALTLESMFKLTKAQGDINLQSDGCLPFATTALIRGHPHNMAIVSQTKCAHVHFKYT